MKTHQAIVLISAFIVSFSVNAQGDKSTYRSEKVIGIGASPIINFQTNKNNSGNKASQLNVGLIATANYHITEKLIGNIGVGIVKTNFSTQLQNEISKYTRTAFVLQASLFRAIYAFNIFKTILDIQVGLMGVYQNGNDHFYDDFNVLQVSYPFTKLAIAPGAKSEWFVNQHLCLHLQIGMLMSMIQTDNSGYTNNGVRLGLFQSSELLGQAGFTFYFQK